MVHLSDETLSELLDGGSVPGADEHLATCVLCRGELDGLQQLRAELRQLPELEPPVDQWLRIAERLPGGRARRRLGWPSLIALQAAAMAAVFVIGLGLGRFVQPDSSVLGGAASEPTVAQEPQATSLSAAMSEVRQRGAEYDRALKNLQRLARQEGAPLPFVSNERLASLDALVEASRTALSADPADPVLNSYLFAALEERDAVMQQMSATQESGSELLWR